MDPQDVIAQLIRMRQDAGAPEQTPADIVDWRFPEPHEVFSRPSDDPIDYELGSLQRTPSQQVATRFPDLYDEGQIASMNGLQRMPSVRVNPAGWDAFMAQAPESENIEDRRPDPEAFIRSVLSRGQ